MNYLEEQILKILSEVIQDLDHPVLQKAKNLKARFTENKDILKGDFDAGWLATGEIPNPRFPGKISKIILLVNDENGAPQYLMVRSGVGGKWLLGKNESGKYVVTGTI